MSRLSLVVPLIVVLAACGGDIEPGSRPAEAPVVAGLKTAEVGTRALPANTGYVGTVESRDRGVLAARTDGRISRVAVRAGDRVEAGTRLLTIAENQAADRLREAEAGVGGAQNRLAAARARAQLAQQTFERYRRLFAKEAVTPQEMDRVTAEKEEARRQEAAAAAAVTAAEAGRSAARTALAYTQVRAPYAGRVVRLEVEEGSTVQPGTPLLVLDRRGGAQVRAEIPEREAGRIAAGQPVQVAIPALGRTVPAVVGEIEPAADPRSRTVTVTVDLPAQMAVTPGLFARVIFAGADRPALLLPAAAIVERGQLTGVYVVKEGVLQYRLIKTGREIDGEREVLSGLAPGEVVVIDGVERARSGARVED